MDSQQQPCMSLDSDEQPPQQQADIQLIAVDGCGVQVSRSAALCIRVVRAALEQDPHVSSVKLAGVTTESLVLLCTAVEAHQDAIRTVATSTVAASAASTVTTASSVPSPQPSPSTSLPLLSHLGNIEYNRRLAQDEATRDLLMAVHVAWDVTRGAIHTSVAQMLQTIRHDIEELDTKVAQARAVMQKRLTEAGTKAMHSSSSSNISSKRGRGGRGGAGGAVPRAVASRFMILDDDVEAESETAEGQLVATSHSRKLALETQETTLQHLVTRINSSYWFSLVDRNGIHQAIVDAGCSAVDCSFDVVDAAWERHQAALSAFQVAWLDNQSRADCRFKSEDHVHRHCIYCRDLETAQDIKDAWNAIRALIYLDVPELLPAIQTKLFRLVRRVLYEWQRQVYSPGDAAYLDFLARLDAVLSCFGCSKTSMSTAPDVSVVSFGVAAVFKPVVFREYNCLYGSRECARSSIEHRKRSMEIVLQLATGMDKRALRSLLDDKAFSLLEACDLVECAFMQGYSITGGQSSKDDAVLTEPYWPVIKNLLTSVILPLQRDAPEQLVQFEQISLRYRTLLLEHKRPELAAIFGISQQHLAHFKEAPTLQKFFAWRRAGADVDVPLQTLDALATPVLGFQEETRSVDQIRRDQIAKHQAQQAKLQAEKLAKKKLAARGGGAQGSKGKPAAVAPSTTVASRAPPKARTLASSAAASASSLTDSTHAGDKSTIASMEQQLQAAEKQLAAFDSRLDLMGNCISFRGRSTHVIGEDGTRLTETRRSLCAAIEQLRKPLRDLDEKAFQLARAHSERYTHIRREESSLLAGDSLCNY